MWAAFLQAHNSLILHVARSFGGDHDAAMDRYTYILEQLRGDDFKRLRQYRSTVRSKFTTWLVVVSRRLCIDRERLRYGRPKDSSKGQREDLERRTRRNLEDLLGEHEDFSRLLGDEGENPESHLRARELQRALGKALTRLEGRDRLLVTLRYRDGLSGREISELLGFPSPFHVYRHLRGINKTLRAALEESGVGGSEP